MEDWETIDTAPDREVVETKIDDKDGERNVQKMKKRDNLWWFPDDSMYVYYRPTHWRPVSKQLN